MHWVKLHGSVVHEPTHTTLNSKYDTVTGVPMLFRQSRDGMLEYVSNVDMQVTFAYKDVHFINCECAAAGLGACRLKHSPPSPNDFTRTRCMPLS